MATIDDVMVNPENGQTVFKNADGQFVPTQVMVHPQTKEMVMWNGKGWETLQQKRTAGLKQVDDLGRAVAQGATFGFADEFSAKANELTGSGTYEKNLAQEQARNKQMSPGIAIPGEVAGGVATAMATAPITGPLAAISGASKLPAWARAVGIGTGTGGLYGAGTAEPGERMEGAAHGAAIGGPAGLGGYTVARGIQGTAGGVRNAMSPEANVTADLGRAMLRDKLAPADLVSEFQRMKGSGLSPTGADIGGENVKGLVERIAQTPGAGRTVVVPALTARQQGQMVRLTNDLMTLTGSRQSSTQAISETIAQRTKDAGPAYDDAMNFNARGVPEVMAEWNKVTSTGWGQSVLKSPDFRKNLQTEYGISDPTNAPMMVVIDAFKKEIDGLVREARKGNMNRARILGDMRDDLVSVVDKHNPKYAEARDKWAGPTRYLDAIDEGRNIFDTKVSGEELRAGINAMSDADREGYRIGAISAIAGRMGADPSKLGDMTKFVRSPLMREKVAALMPTPEAAEAWTNRLAFEVKSSEMTNRAMGNSATARRLAEKEDAESIVGDLVMDTFMGKPPRGLLANMVTAVPRKIRDTLRSKSDNILAELLTDPTSMDGLVKAIERVQSRGVRNIGATAPAVAGAITAEKEFN